MQSRVIPVILTGLLAINLALALPMPRIKGPILPQMGQHLGNTTHNDTIHNHLKHELPALAGTLLPKRLHEPNDWPYDGWPWPARTEEHRRETQMPEPQRPDETKVPTIVKNPDWFILHNATEHGFNGPDREY